MEEQEVSVRLSFEGTRDSINFDINTLKDLAVSTPLPCNFERVKSAELKDMYHQSFELDKDHVAHVFLPVSFFETE